MKYIFNNDKSSEIKTGESFIKNLKLINQTEFPFIRIMLINTFAMSLFGLATPLAVQSVINSITSTALIQPLVLLCIILFFILGFNGVIQVIQTYTVEILKRRIFVRIGLTITERLSHYVEEHYRKLNRNSLNVRYFDSLIMQTSLVNFFVDGFSFLIMVLIGFGLLAFYHPYFIILEVLIALSLVIIWKLFGPAGMSAGTPEANGKYQVISWIDEISRVRNLFNSEYGRKFANKKITYLFNQWQEKRSILFKSQFNQHISLQIFTVAINVALLFLGGYLVLLQQLSLGQLVAASLVLSNIISNVPRLQNFFTAVFDYSTAVDQIAHFYNCPIEEEVDKKYIVKDFNINFNNIFVEPNYYLNFSIPQFKKIYVYAKSFSTLQLIYDLMIGFQNPKKGEIQYDSVHQNDTNLEKFRDHIQLIRSDQFFNGTIKENLVEFSGHKVESSHLQEALIRVGVWENIELLPDKLNTVIQPSGYPLSKSQILALQMAKAIINQPKFLIVTHDFEKISSFKKSIILKELVNPANQWTLLFCSHLFYQENFDGFAILDRKGWHSFDSIASIMKEVNP
jgi:putative ABC transport system ATP-binding protein